MTLTRASRLRIGGLAFLAVALAVSAAATAQDSPQPPMELDWNQGRLEILCDGKPIALYRFAEPNQWRPCFQNLRTPDGIQVTRNQPPIEGQDLLDHPTFHPGLWLAFGDVNGADDWREKARVRSAIPYVNGGSRQAGSCRFAMRFSYREQDDPEKEICQEAFRCEVRAVPQAFLYVWDSTFTSDHEFYFGDQEEMGLGFRVATPLRAQRQAEAGVAGGNGEIRDAEGRVNEAGVWGNSADWCDYSGTIDGRRVGMTIFCHPKNFRPSWFHARDRGLLVANPFGRAAFKKGEPSKVVVKPGESLRLRYGVLVHSSPVDKPIDVAAAYQDYVKRTAEE